MDGEERVCVVSSGAMNLNIGGEWVYYTNRHAGDRIFRIKKDGTSVQELNQERSGETWRGVNNWRRGLNVM